MRQHNSASEHFFAEGVTVSAVPNSPEDRQQHKGPGRTLHPWWKGGYPELFVRHVRNGVELNGSPKLSTARALEEDMVLVLRGLIAAGTHVFTEDMLRAQVGFGAEPVFKKQPREDLYFVRQACIPDAAAMGVTGVPRRVEGSIGVPSSELSPCALENSRIHSISKGHALQRGNKFVQLIAGSRG